ncbi:MAG TPA: alpha-L-fucosidase, partial [Flavisolibacter sp.]
MKRNRFSEYLKKCVRQVSLHAAFAAVSFLVCPCVFAQRDSREVKKHFLPKSDRQYRYTSGYIEDIPVKEYSWASDKAYEDFNDMKYGVRIHWGLYSIIGQQKESWPLLRKTNEEKQAYFDMYKTWKPKGFNADEWMDLFSESGMKVFAFTAKHHEGFSMFDTKTRVKRRVNYLAPGGPRIEDCDLAFSIMETPFKRDVVKELTDAAHKRNIKVDLYFS